MINNSAIRKDKSMLFVLSGLNGGYHGEWSNPEGEEQIENKYFHNMVCYIIDVTDIRYYYKRINNKCSNVTGCVKLSIGQHCKTQCLKRKKKEKKKGKKESKMSAIMQAGAGNGVE